MQKAKTEVLRRVEIDDFSQIKKGDLFYNSNNPNQLYQAGRDGVESPNVGESVLHGVPIELVKKSIRLDPKTAGGLIKALQNVDGQKEIGVVIQAGPEYQRILEVDYVNLEHPLGVMIHVKESNEAQAGVK